MTPSATLTAPGPAGTERRDAAIAGGAGQATTSARRGGGPEDRALYECGCGHAFKAHVSTSVGCPHCGTRQAW